MTGFDLRAPDFWDRRALDTELTRVYDICNGCRRCLPLCPSFREQLFPALDRDEVDGEAERLTQADREGVVDLCYQCKLCYNHCPYTPPHRFMLDFPRLMLRARAVKTRERGGMTRQDRMLGNTALVGRLGSATAPLSNWAMGNAAHRALLQGVVGIHKGRNLPRFHRETFSRWLAAHPAPGPAAPAGRVALFHTCSVEYSNPEIGRATVGVLRHHRVDVTCPPQRCCGMPYLDGGGVAEATRLIDDNVRALGPAVREGREVVVPGPTCSYMMKQEWPALATDRETAGLIAERTRDVFEYLASLHAAGRLDLGFRARPGRVAYQLPCHLKAQNIGTKSADVLKLCGAEVRVIDRCSAVDGTWGLKREYYELSKKVAEPLFRAVREARADRTATDCPLAALQIVQGTGQRVCHPIQILAEAYGLAAD
jgi:Fe-S oxidoreductase